VPPGVGYGAPGGDSSVLNAPPPSMAQPLAPTAGMQGSVAGLAGTPMMPSGMIPPEVLGGMIQVAQQLDQHLDTFAQITPDLAADWLAIKDMLQRAMGKLLVAGGQPPSPTAAGPAFAGGGLDRGGMAS
jgi:hypothetical protein